MVMHLSKSWSCDASSHQLQCTIHWHTAAQLQQARLSLLLLLAEWLWLCCHNRHESWAAEGLWLAWQMLQALLGLGSWHIYAVLRPYCWPCSFYHDRLRGCNLLGRLVAGVQRLLCCWECTRQLRQLEAFGLAGQHGLVHNQVALRTVSSSGHANAGPAGQWTLTCAPVQFVGSCVHFQRMGTGCQCLNLLFGLVICLLLLPCADSAISVCLGISKSPCKPTWVWRISGSVGTMPGSGHSIVYWRSMALYAFNKPDSYWRFIKCIKCHRPSLLNA